jgi:hypothetical protein
MTTKTQPKPEDTLIAGPRTFAEAVIVHSEFSVCAQRALLDLSEFIPRAIKELNSWAKWLPDARVLIDHEIEQQKRTYRDTY